MTEGKKTSKARKREQPQKTYGPQQRSGAGGSYGRPHKSAEHLAGKSRKVH